MSSETTAPTSPRNGIPDLLLLETRQTSSVSLGISGTALKGISPNVGIWGQYPIRFGNGIRLPNRNRWSGFGLLQKETIRLEDRTDSSFRFFTGFRSAWFSESGVRSSVQLGWERGESDLLVFGIHFEIPERQGFQLLGKTGSEFRSVSLLLHSPLRAGAHLIFGISRIHTENRPEGREDSYSFGIGWTWDKAEFSVFGFGSESSDSSIGGKWGWDFAESETSAGNENVSKSLSEISSIDPKRPVVTRKSVSPITRYTIRKLSLQELLSFGLSLDSSLRISRESAGSAEDFGTFLETLSDRDQAKVFALLRKKNPKPRRKGNPS
ncbi:hypothetical protein EHQ12_05045 [Leptospira gomenensis]|uniref:Uncharacterized protein n=1 Tax=Leptospira gomenensis TaxID=2484974 RepID=A0A5F1Y6R6_9LEPT|nr:hypothetical protein [Leptospira gomenensis]TGK28928.1 hypothetical protein EHQ17_16315 [Leptospira gomenensis]TGK40687.1 hypothetical protein EHQ07_17660 [Leptospira gomenensis]TGK42508.1 hypothetical protein EHQ12_05045 [Leptospira gomenensis]TGK68469.1 hypothetical protein EHQ13_00395 [Leptospira gomenensis]